MRDRRHGRHGSGRQLNKEPGEWLVGVILRAFLYALNIQRKEQKTHENKQKKNGGKSKMAFFNSAVTTLQTLVVAIGAGLGVWGIVNLLEGYGSDNPGAKSQGIKQLMAGGGIVLIGTNLVPLLSGLF